MRANLGGPDFARQHVYMSELLSRFTYQDPKMTSQVWLLAFGIWLAVMGCTIYSIMMQPFTMRQRLVWVAIVLGLPIIGLLAYLPFSIRRDELPTAFLMRGTADKGRKKNKVIPPK
jgi:hypothetical protein